jgi:hypothetical protein
MSYARALVLLLVPAVAFAGATASKFKAEHRKGANYWNAQSAIDGKLDTCWMVPGESPNRGEWIELDLPKSTVDKIGMVVGWAQTEDTFADFARIKAIKVDAFSLNDRQELSPRGSATAQFQDDMAMQIVDIDDLQVGEDLFGGKLRINVADIYDGRDYPNMAISELLVYLIEFDTKLKAPEFSDLSSTPAGPNLAELALDEDAKTFFATAQDGGFIQVEASGFGVSSLGIQLGPKSHARPKKIKVSANNRELVYDLEDNDEVQWVLVPTITGYTGGAFGEIKVEFLEVYPGDDPNVAIAEVYGRATNYEGF